jgi:GNAT superfamily N-acetyltransferase
MTAVEDSLQVVAVHPHDELAAPLFAELAVEYDTRYGDLFGGTAQEFARYPAAEFLPPDGELILVLEDGTPVAGGAFRRHDDPGTAEVKRMWTSAAHRRRGLARRVLAELEQRATSRGYTRMYLTTGPRQPEAKALYLVAGWTPLFDLDRPRPTDLETLRTLPLGQLAYAFEKLLGDPA